MFDKIIEFITTNYIVSILVLYVLARLFFSSSSNNTKFEEYPGNKVKTITNDAVYNDIVKESMKDNKIIIIDFYATWCPPCRRAAPIYGKMSTEYDNVIFAKADVDSQRSLSQIHEVRAMPTFVIIKNGKQVDSVTGWDERRIRSMIERNQTSINNTTTSQPKKST